MIFLKFNTKNIIPAKFRNPLYFCSGDSPDKIEMCWTELGANERQLFTFLSGQIYKISSMQIFDVSIYATNTSVLCFGV